MSDIHLIDESGLFNVPRVSYLGGSCVLSTNTANQFIPPQVLPDLSGILEDCILCQPSG